jgi:pyruvate kinase
VAKVKHTAGGERAGGNVEDLISELTAIRAEMIAAVQESAQVLKSIHPQHRKSARNLLQYLTLRRRDLRPIQSRLAELGLSSLGRSEAHALATIDAVLSTLHKIAQREWSPPDEDVSELEFRHGQDLLREHTVAMLGEFPRKRNVHIMVTMPSEAATDYSLVADLLKSGMNCMRINCAHDAAEAWSAMIEHLRRAMKATGRDCKVMMDLAGPKLRTGPVQPGPAVIKYKPQRDDFGLVVSPARVWMATEKFCQSSPSPAHACIAVDPEWLAGIRIGDKVRFTDARGARRSLKAVDKTEEGCWLEGRKSAYIANDTVFYHRLEENPDKMRSSRGQVSGKEAPIHLSVGDLLIVRPDMQPGRPATVDSSGKILTPAAIGCTLGVTLRNVKIGEMIWFDDGRIGGVVEAIKSKCLHVRIRHAPLTGGKLRGDKGINLPDSELKLPALTEKDSQDLDFIARYADLVGLSFANNAADVRMLREQLNKFCEKQPGLVLKIETRAGFRNLPAMLLEAMSGRCCGVMIARGDLAVESGFERLAEVQEEILWLCEAAHVPVIWATQVLETLAKRGAPTRAEITDAAMAHRAECVMLNKGPYIIHAVRMLDDILKRMQSHQFKKQSMLRQLGLAYASPVGD